MKTLIAIPCMDQVPAQFCESLANLKRVGECEIAFKISSLIYTSRDALAKEALKIGAKYILWLDSDIVFAPDLMIRMINTIKEDTILTGVYYRRGKPYKPVIFDELELTENGWKWSDCENLPDMPFEIEGCGFGCVLMPTEAVAGVMLNFKQIFNPISGIGEDLSFCWRVRQSGYKIICDPTLKVGHVGHMVIGEDFYNTYKENKK